MSDIGGSSNGAFDLPFLALQALMALVFVTALLAVPRPLLGLRVAHAAACAGLPLLWLVAWPVTSGIEGAGRFLIGAPASLFPGLLGLTWVAVAARRSDRPVWSTAWPSAAAVGACVAVWAVFLAM